MKTHATRLSSLVAALAALCAFAETPDAFLDYVEATGTQMVDTGCLIGSNYTIVAEYAYPDPIVGQGNYLFGVYKQGMTAGFFYSNSGSYPLRFQKANGTSGATTTDANINATPNAKQTVTMHVGSGTSSIVSESGETLYSGSLGGTIKNNSTAPLALFTVNIGGSPSSSYTSVAKIYYLRIYNGDGAMVCNLLPCRKDNRAALYDKVTGNILFASGGDLVAGPVLPRPAELVEWLQSDGADGSRTLFFDAGVPGKAGIGMVAEMSWCERPASDSTFCGSMLDSSHYFSLYRSAGTHQMGYGTWHAQIQGGNNAPVAGVRYRVASSLSAGAQYLNVKALDGSGYDGTRTYNTASSIDSGNNLYVFARNDAGSPAQFAKARLYSLVLTNEVGLVRDFIPCVADNGKAGLYDRVSERVFFPQAAVANATAEFDFDTEVGAVTNRATVGGWPATRPEYIVADGARDYVDLGITARDGLKMTAELEWVANLASAATFCGAATNGSSALFTLYRATSDFHRMGYYNGSSTLGGANCAPAAGVRYRVSTSLDNGEQTLAVKKFDNGAWVPVGQGSRTVNLSFPAGYADLGLPLYLFARNLNGTPDEFAAVRFYSLKLWQKNGQGNHVLVRDIKPAYHPGDNSPALFDRLNGVWYFNKGAYRLSAGGATSRFVGRATVIFVR